ncbi:hypothetical protein C2W62_16345 [Candidatus Entotheonella serta]|nr:hypothetical protein C2W62_16345 [Candidatus Entotheonella serta]
MEGSTHIVLDERFVIHVLDHRQPAAQCSQSLTPLPESFRSTLEAYMLSLLKPRFRRKHFGRFRADSPVLNTYRELLDSVKRFGRVEDAIFLEASQALARHLFRSMQQLGAEAASGRPGVITPGDLLVGLFYTESLELEPTPYLFMIKVDLEKGVQRQIETPGNGALRTVLRQQEGLLPKISASHVQKSALIRWADDPQLYDVIMTDPQGGKQGIAKFFAEDFLQTEPFRTDEEKAELLFRRTHSWIVDQADELSPQESGEVIEAVRNLFETHRDMDEPVSPRELVEAMPLREPRDTVVVQALKQSFAEALAEPEADEEPIPADLEIVLQTLPQPVVSSRVTYELDGGVRLSGDRQAIERLFLRPPERGEHGTEFTIRTSTFRPIL